MAALFEPLQTKLSSLRRQKHAFRNINFNDEYTHARIECSKAWFPLK